MASNPARSTVRDSEVAHFGALAAEWWDPRGSSAMLHRLNPVRLAYIRDRVVAHWDLDPRGFRPLEGRRVLDVGCGAGLLCEPLARMGADVTGIDATPANIDAARAHAGVGGLDIRYVAGGVEALDAEPFDLVTSMEVIEHVDDPAFFVARLARLVRPDGLLVLSTPNRTARSRLAMITIGEGLNLVPRGTHDWNRFLTPAELAGHVKGNGLTMTDTTGIGFDPGRGFALSPDVALNYLMTAVPGNPANR